MTQLKNRKSPSTSQTSQLFDRIFLVVIASTALLLSALAATIVLNRSADLPPVFVSDVPEVKAPASTSEQYEATIARRDATGFEIDLTGIKRVAAKQLAPTVDLASILELDNGADDKEAGSVTPSKEASNLTSLEAPSNDTKEKILNAASKSVNLEQDEAFKARVAAERAAKAKLAVKLALLRPTSRQLENLARATEQQNRTRNTSTQNVVESTPHATETGTDPAPVQNTGRVAISSPFRRSPHPEQAATLPGIDGISRQQTASISKPGAIQPPVPTLKPRAPETSLALAPRNTDPKPAEVTPTLAYATPGNPTEDENGTFSGIEKLFRGGGNSLSAARQRGVAVYDISAAIVHMPDGTKLEAHSGIGHRKDNPKYAYVKNLGPTPPNVYKLRMRERRFHGVEAIRMLPHDRAAMKGRDGMLAHTPLLRRSNGSHGCVAFKHYAKFLKAFKAGKVKTMIVVPSLNDLPTYMAKLDRKKDA